MNFFDEIYETAKTLTDKTTQKAEELVDKGKTHLQIYKLRAELRKCYTHLGIRVYNKAKAGEELGEVVSMRIHEIDLLREQIAELKEQADLIKYCQKCKNCGVYNDKEDEICLNCGANLHPYHKTVYSVNFSKDEDKE